VPVTHVRHTAAPAQVIQGKMHW